MLATDTKTPVMSQTSMSSNLLESFQVLTKLIVKSIGCDLRVLSILDIFLSIQEPVRDLVLTWIGDDGNELLNLILCQLSSSFPHIHISFLADNVSKSSTNSFDCSQCVHDVPFTIYVCVHNTKDVLELLWYYQTLLVSLQQNIRCFKITCFRLLRLHTFSAMVD